MENITIGRQTNTVITLAYKGIVNTDVLDKVDTGYQN